MVLASAQPHPSFPPGRGKSWQEQGKGGGGRQAALQSECFLTLTLGGSSQGGHRKDTGGGRLQKRRSKYCGSTAEGAEPLCSPSTMRVPVQEWELWPELCSEPESVALKLCVRLRCRGSPSSPQVRQSVSQPHRACPRQSEVENRHIKEVTDTFTLIQVVDVIVVSGGRRKAEKGGKHCREHQAEA